MKNLVPVLAVLLVSLSSCNKLTQFDISYDTSFTISSSTGINLPTNIITPDIPSNSETQFEVNDTRKENIEEILLQELSLTITSPSNGTFNFLKTVRIFLNAEGLSEIKIANKENMTNTDSKTIQLDVVCVDLQEYIKKDNFSIRVETVTDEILSPDHEVDLNSVFFVDAKLIK